MMQVVVELSFYPFAKDYDSLIFELVRRLRSYSDIEVTPGQTATVIRGEYDLVFEILTKECKTALGGENKAAIVMKVLNLV